jgi:hypothetical protein
MRVSAVPTPDKVVGTGGNKPNPQILRIELLASYAHEIAHSAVALHYGRITADSLFPLFPQGAARVGTRKALCRKGCRMFPLFPQKNRVK